MTTEPSDVLLSHHHSDSLVAVGCPSCNGLTQSKTRQDLLSDAAKIAARLPSLHEGQHVLLVFRQDRYAFAATLLAVWSRGYPACLPANQRGATVAELLRSGDIGVLLHDTAAMGHLSVPEILAETDRLAPLGAIKPPEPVAVRVMTSGSTGQSVPWDKSPYQLLEEVKVLAKTFALGQGLTYVVTVPPSHLYGLLFGVLLPLATGSSFTRNTPLLPGEVAATVQSSRAQVLISVPTHLRAARSLPSDALASLSRVFSSAGPLPEETARVFTARHTTPITEIFGSTETGGIAWRQRHEGSSWRPFEPVSTAQTPDNLLVVSSPFTNAGVDGKRDRFTTSDRINLLPDGRFEHLGRQDGIVKIGGQRISVPAVEDCLMQHPEVDDVAVLALDDEVRGHRLLAAVSGPPHLEEACRTLLLSQFEPSTLPRRFLFLDKLPREANGKLMRSRLLRLFGLNDSGSALTRSIDFTAQTAEAKVSATIDIPQDYIAYSGHFDQYPVLAGAIQVQHLVMPVLNSAKPEWLYPSELKRVKFMGRIEPGDRVRVELALKEHECEFTISKSDKVCSAGALVFKAEVQTND